MKIIGEHFMVHKNQQRHKYEEAERGDIALLYDRNPHDPARDLGRDWFSMRKPYWVPPEKALELYRLICAGTDPETIISTLNLRQRPMEEIAEELEERLRRRHAQGFSVPTSEGEKTTRKIVPPKRHGEIDAAEVEELKRRSQVLEHRYGGTEDTVITSDGGEEVELDAGGFFRSSKTIRTRGREIFETIVLRDPTGATRTLERVRDIPGDLDKNQDADYRERWVEV